MSNPRTTGTPVRVLDKRFKDRAGRICFVEHPLYHVKLAKSIGDPPPDEYDTRAEIVLLSYSKIELL